jgi:hypothetical protein
MTSNYQLSQYLEEKLTEIGSSITELRAFATSLGVDLTIQADDIWISRPGLSQAIVLDIPSRAEDLQNGRLHVLIQSIADDLWQYADPIDTPPAIIL